MPDAPSPAQQAASRANGARSRGPATAAGKARAAQQRHPPRPARRRFCPLPGEDAEELDLLRQAVAADWHPRDAYERHWAAELVAAMWRQQRLRQLEFAALEAASQEHPPTEASLKRLLTFARYGARIDKELAQALRALRVLKARPAASLAEQADDYADCTREPERASPEPERPLPIAAAHARTRAAGTGGGQPTPGPCREAPEPPRAPPPRGPGAPGHARGRLERRRSPQAGPRPIGKVPPQVGRRPIGERCSLTAPRPRAAR